MIVGIGKYKRSDPKTSLKNISKHIVFDTVHIFIIEKKTTDKNFDDAYRIVTCELLRQDCYIICIIAAPWLLRGAFPQPCLN